MTSFFIFFIISLSLSSCFWLVQEEECWGQVYALLFGVYSEKLCVYIGMVIEVLFCIEFIVGMWLVGNALWCTYSSHAILFL